MSHIAQFTTIKPDHVGKFTALELSNYIAKFSVITPNHVGTFTALPYTSVEIDEPVSNFFREFTFLETARQDAQALYWSDIMLLIRKNDKLRTAALDTHCSAINILEYTSLIKFVETVKGIMLEAEIMGVQKTAKYFADLFKLDDVRKCYVPKNINAQSIYDIYELGVYNPVTELIDPTISPSIYDGIFTAQFNSIFA